MTKVEFSETIWEKLGAAEGLWATILLTVQFLVLRTTTADLTAGEGAFAAALEGERMHWEVMTFLRIVAGLMIIWFMGSLAGRLRLAEGEPGRLATIAFGVGTLWGTLWLLSALFNSAAVLFAVDYDNATASRMAGMLAIEIVDVLLPAIAVVLTFATALVGRRFGGFSKLYANATLATSGLLLVLALVDWYGPGNLSLAIVALAHLWLAVTSALLMQRYVEPDPVLGGKARVAARP